MTLFKKAVVPFRLGRVLSLTSNFAAVAIALMVFAAPANAQQTGDIGGQVTDASGNGIAGYLEVGPPVRDRRVRQDVDLPQS